MAVYTHVDPACSGREATSRAIHRLDEIEVYRLEPALLDAIERAIDRSTELEIVRTDGRLYVTVEGKVIESDLTRVSLVAEG